MHQENVKGKSLLSGATAIVLQGLRLQCQELSQAEGHPKGREVSPPAFALPSLTSC